MTLPSRLRLLIYKYGMIVGLVGLVLFTRSHGSASSYEQDVFVTVTSQPINVGDAKAAALAYYNSGAYQRDLEAVAAQAASWIDSRAASVTRPALVLDIDETALSNWEILKRDDFGRPIAGPCDLAIDAPCGWAAWDQLGRDPAIAPTLQVFQRARESAAVETTAFGSSADNALSEAASMSAQPNTRSDRRCATALCAL